MNFPGTEKIYMLTAAPGLEAVAMDEAARKINAAPRGLARGKAFIHIPAAPFPFEQIRSADNVYEYLFSAAMGHTRGALAQLTQALARAPYYEILCGHMRGQAYFSVNASVAGRHNYSRFEAAGAFAKALEGKYKWLQAGHRPDEVISAPAHNNHSPVEFRLDIENGQIMAYTKLTGAAYRFRGAERGFTKAALRPTVAHALVWLSRPRDGEIFLDPFCGSGTILCERVAYPYQKLMGIDRDGEALAAARGNLTSVSGCPSILFGQPVLKRNGSYTAVELFTGDMRAIQLDAASVDTVVTNPPWGMQIKTDGGGPRALYASFLAKTACFLKPGGRVILLTPWAEMAAQAAEAAAFSSSILHTVSLHGTLCEILQLTHT